MSSVLTHATELPSRSDRPILVGLARDELTHLLETIGQPRFRARQIERWLYQEHVFDPEQMHDLPLSVRQWLAEGVDLLPLRCATERTSDLGLTHKALFELRDAKTIESVLMRYPPTDRGRARRTVCISSQVGCGIGCPFCATGLTGLLRNLTAAEIAGQVLYFAGRVRQIEGPEARITNVVLMGQGEPLANFRQVWRAIEILNDSALLGLGARHVTISTSGLVPRIYELADKPLQVGLAVSLHAPTDELRDRLVPINRKYPIKELIEACRAYVARTHRRISFEYALMAGVNDHLDLAVTLSDLIQGLNCHVNLIPLNEVEGSPFRPTHWPQLVAFQQIIQGRGIPCTVRIERGDPIDAACGQLRANYEGQSAGPLAGEKPVVASSRPSWLEVTE